MSAATRIVDRELVDAHAASRLGTYLGEVWHRRGYAWYVAQSDLRQRQITTVFGSFWHLLNPVLSIAVYFLIFGLILKTDRGVDNYLLFLTVGLFVFQYTQRAVTQGSTSIVANRGIMQAIRFPRVLLPLSATVTETLAALPTFVVIYGVALVLGEAPRLTWVVLPVLVAWQMLFNLGCAMIAARLTTHFRDTQQLLPFVFRLLLYGSGVIFAVDAYVTNRSLELIFVLNPVYGFIEMARWAIMGSGVSAEVVASVAIWTAVVLVGGFFWFKAAEHSYHRV